MKGNLFLWYPSLTTNLRVKSNTVRSRQEDLKDQGVLLGDSEFHFAYAKTK